MSNLQEPTSAAPHRDPCHPYSRFGISVGVALLIESLAMRKLAIALLLTACLAPAQSVVGLRILFGLEGKIGDQWDGSVTAQGARITSVEPWRFDSGDQMGSNNSWKASVHAMRTFGGAQQ